MKLSRNTLRKIILQEVNILREFDEKDSPVHLLAYEINLLALGSHSNALFTLDNSDSSEDEVVLYVKANDNTQYPERDLDLAKSVGQYKITITRA